MFLPKLRKILNNVLEDISANAQNPQNDVRNVDMKRLMVLVLLCLCVLLSSCASRTANGSADLRQTVEAEFKALQSHYSRYLGEKVIFKIEEVDLNKEHDYIHVVFDVSPAKYKPMGNKISVLRTRQNGEAYHLQIMHFSKQGEKYVGLFGHQIGVDLEQCKQIEIEMD